MKSVWEILVEYDIMAGPMDRPDWDRKGNPWNFRTMQGDAQNGGPANASGDTGQSGVGRGGIGWGGRKDVSGGIRLPSAVYDKTWQQDEGFDDRGGERHGSPRNVWRDTPDGEEWTEMNNEAMGLPMSFSLSNKAGNMWGAHTVPGSEKEPSARKNWIPEEDDMKLKEFFDPNPIPVEEIDNPNQDHFKDQTDDDLESKIDKNYGLESNDDFGEPPDSPLPDDGDEEMSLQAATMSILPPKGPAGLLPPGGQGGEVVDKASAWDVLQKVVDALGNNLNDGV